MFVNTETIMESSTTPALTVTSVLNIQFTHVLLFCPPGEHALHMCAVALTITLCITNWTAVLPADICHVAAVHGSQVGRPSGFVEVVQNWHSPAVGADLEKGGKKWVTISMAEKPGPLVVFKCGVKGGGCKIYWCRNPSLLIGRSARTICSLERHWATAWPLWHNWGETGQKILFSPILFYQSGLTNSAEWEAGRGEGEGGGDN